MTDHDGYVKYELALLSVALIWGINFPAVKYAFRYVAPLTFNAVRFTVSVGFLAVLVYRENGSLRQKVHKTPRRWIALLGLGLLGHFAYQVGFVVGLDLSTAGISAFLISTSPIWTATIGAITGKDRLLPAAWVGLIVAFVGASALIVGRSGLDIEDTTFYGNVLSFLAAVAWGSFTALSRPLLDDHSPSELAFWTMLFALPFLWVVAVPDPAVLAGLDEPIVWVILLFSGIMSTGVAYVLWNAGIRHVGPAHTAVFANLVPVAAFTIGVFWLGETATAYEITGAGAILVGLFIMRRARTSRRSASRDQIV